MVQSAAPISYITGMAKFLRTGPRWLGTSALAGLACVALLAAGPAVAQSPAAGQTGSNGCQAGQVLQANGDPCNPAAAPLPPTTVNILGPSPVEMSRALAVVPVAEPSTATCASGQVLQGNGQPCSKPATTPAGASR